MVWMFMLKILISIIKEGICVKSRDAALVLNCKQGKRGHLSWQERPGGINFEMEIGH